jgi:hypothetical protein
MIREWRLIVACNSVYKFKQNIDRKNEGYFAHRLMYEVRGGSRLSRG